MAIREFVANFINHLKALHEYLTQVLNEKPLLANY